MGGTCRPWGRSLTAEEARPPRVLSNCLARPGAWSIQTTGSLFYHHSTNMDRKVVKEGECDPGYVVFLTAACPCSPLAHYWNPESL